MLSHARVQAAVYIGLLSMSSITNADGKFVVNIDGRHEFETKADAENFIRTYGGAPAEKYREVARRADSSREVVVYVYKTPRVGERFLLDTKYGTCSTNAFDYCDSEEAYVQFVAQKIAEANPNICVFNTRAEGIHLPGTWSWAGYPFDVEYDLVNVKTGRRIVYEAQPKTSGYCQGPITTVRSNGFFRYDFYTCEEGYAPLPGYPPFPEDGLCQHAQPREIETFVTQECSDGSPSTGNPCGILNGNKHERETDMKSDDLQLTRTYNSSQLN